MYFLIKCVVGMFLRTCILGSSGNDDVKDLVIAFSMSGARLFSAKKAMLARATFVPLQKKT